MIDPSFDQHRSRLARSLEFWHDEFKKYRDARRETIALYAGSPEFASTTNDGEIPKKVWGNLIQLSGQSHVVNLAYGDPQFAVIANVPEADEIVPRLEEFLNRWTRLICLGDVIRAVALDSFVGYGIFHTGLGALPTAARHLSGQEVGPLTERVSQDYFLYDGSATTWDKVSWIGHLFDVPLDEARDFGPFNEYNAAGAAALEEYGIPASNREGRLHNTEGKERTAQPMTRLVRIFFPGTTPVIATWPANDINFGSVADEPLLIERYTGHPDGPYNVLSHLDIPDNLLPVPLVESTKHLNWLFNELMEITSDSALKAKFLNMYDVGNERDVTRLEGAENRTNVGVTNVDRFKPFQIPGPDQTVTAHMGSSLALFKELSGNLDDTLGLAPTAATASQSNLIRSRTNARGAEAMRRRDRAVESVARKLAHLALASENLRLPARRPLPQSSINVPLDWMPRLPENWEQLQIDPSAYQARSANADDYDIGLVLGSMQHRAPEERLAAIGQAIGRMTQIAQMIAAGVPFDMEEYVEIEAKYGNLPEIRRICMAFLPEFKARREGAELASRPPGTGEYTRTSVSERSNGGALTQLLSQVGQPGGVE